MSEQGPLQSVWFEDDAKLIEQMMGFYPRKAPGAILDATVNSGRFWSGSNRSVIGIDLDASHRPAFVCDNVFMPFADESFDVVVYDPPHVPNQGRDKTKDFTSRFGLGLKSGKETKYSFSYMFPPFTKEAWRVLRPEGVMFCKIADYVHNHKYQWAHIDLINAAALAGFTPCDCILKVRRGPIMDPKWKTAHHSRRIHVYWIVFRKSNRCE